MPRMKILNSYEVKTFESPPVFNIIERNNFFNFPQRIKETSEGLRTETNKVCFLTMVGYFKATKKFFPRKFHQNDIDFVVQTLGIIPEQIDINSYDRATFLFITDSVDKHNCRS